MIFDELLPGDRFFIDANIFVYHCNGVSVECKALISRCSRKDVRGFTSTAVITETMHRLMIAEAIRKGYIGSKNSVRKLKEHPEIVKQLSEYIEDIQEIYKMNITILSLSSQCIKASTNLQQTEGLLTNDSLIVKVMQDSGISKLATNDNDFDQIPWLQVYKPSDV